jgi:hypothetical protein
MKIDPGMLVCTGEAKPLLIVGSLRELVPDEHILARADRVLDMQWLREVVRDRYVAGGTGCPGIDPEAAVRLMLAGFLPGNVHDRRLLRESDILPLLIARPGLRPVAALEEMRAHHPDHDWDRLRRTPERRVRASRTCRTSPTWANSASPSPVSRWHTARAGPTLIRCPCCQAMPPQPPYRWSL